MSLIQFPPARLRFATPWLPLATAVFAGICSSPCDSRAGAIGQVEVVNLSHPTACAEEDNVDLEFMSSAIVGFTVRATQPSYIANISSELSKPDFRNCPTGGGAPSAAPQKVMLYQSPAVQLVGYRFAHFWRSNAVPVSVGERREVGLQLLQLWVKYNETREEILAFYPPDGYWRLRPLPYSATRRASYGSSIVIGPVERAARRPYVAIKRVVFDPRDRSFRLDFDGGGSARLKLLGIDRQECALSVVFAGPFPRGRPFAAVRSMFVDERHADAARIAWQPDDATQGILSFKTRRVSRMWIGRTAESMHNNTAPDLSIGNFVLGNASR